MSLVADVSYLSPPDWPQPTAGGQPVPGVEWAPAEEVVEQVVGDVQTAVEGAVQIEDDGKVELLGERFRLAESIGLMPLLKFAHSAKGGMDSDDMEGLDAMYSLIRDTVDQEKIQKRTDDGELMTDAAGDPVWEGPSEWDRFERHAIDTKADGEDFMEFIGKAISVISARPRKRRGDSSASSPQTSASSKGSSSLPATIPAVDGLTAVRDLGR